MRLRVLFAGLALALMGVLSVAAPAGAAIQEVTKTADSKIKPTHDGELCIKLLEEGKKVDACQEAPSPILPPINELVWGGISFTIVMVLMWKFAYPGIKAGMNGRTERIQSDLDGAEAQRTEASGVLAEYQAQLSDARGQSARIIEEARQAADEVKATLLAKAEADIAELRARAAADIEAAKVQAIADLRGEVASLAIGAAEQVLERNLDHDTNVALVESYINQVGADR